MKQLIFLGICAFILGCGASSNDRGNASVSSDPTASGSAYNSSDGFAPSVPSSAPGQAPAATVVAAAPVTDTAGTAAVIIPPTNGTAKATTTAADGATPAKTGVTPAEKPAPAADNTADIKKGEALISKSDCLACHKVDAKLLGPSYKDVAAKYPGTAGNINQLADKIKKGGAGVWGAIPMSPHPALSDDDAKAMVKYILSLK